MIDSITSDGAVNITGTVTGTQNLDILTGTALATITGNIMEEEHLYKSRYQQCKYCW